MIEITFLLLALIVLIEVPRRYILQAIASKEFSLKPT